MTMRCSTGISHMEVSYVTQLTLDTIGLGDYQDIRHRNILDWLLE